MDMSEQLYILLFPILRIATNHCAGYIRSCPRRPKPFGERSGRPLGVACLGELSGWGALGALSG